MKNELISTGELLDRTKIKEHQFRYLVKSKQTPKPRPFTAEETRKYVETVIRQLARCFLSGYNNGAKRGAEIDNGR